MIKKQILIALVLLQLVAAGCEKTVDPVVEDEKYLQEHNELSAEETPETLDMLQADKVEDAVSE